MILPSFCFLFCSVVVVVVVAVVLFLFWFGLGVFCFFRGGGMGLGGGGGGCFLAMASKFITSSNAQSDPTQNTFVCGMVFVRGAEDLPITSHIESLQFLFFFVSAVRGP